MRKGAVGPAQDDPASSGNNLALDKYQSVTAPVPTGGRGDVSSGRHGSPNYTQASPSRTLPALTPSTETFLGHAYTTVSSAPKHDHQRYIQRNALRPGGADVQPGSVNPRSIPNPLPAGLATSLSIDSGQSMRFSRYPARQEANKSNEPNSKPPRRPGIAIPEVTKLPSRASPASTISPYGHPPAFNTQPPGPLAASSNMRSMPGLPPPSQLPHPDPMAARSPVAAAPHPRATQFMTVETSHGQMQIPMDVQGASRVADEKRRRNAGASARFRARRKEKEVASSREIEDLKRRIHDLSEDCDFYRQERDVLAAALSNNPEASRLFPRPSSPRRYRTLVDPSSQSEDTQDSPRIQHFEERGEHGESGAHTRRRLHTPPQQYRTHSGQAQMTYPAQPATLPPLQPLQQNHPAPQLPQIRSVSYPGFAASPTGPISPWQAVPRSQSHSQTHSRSQSSSRSYQSGP